MEVGCLRRPGTSAIGSQLQDGDCTGKPDNPAMSSLAPEKTDTRHTDKKWRGDEGGEKPLNAPHKMLWRMREYNKITDNN